MAKAIFTTEVDPTYDDLPEFQYHFPRTYLRAVESTVGDWIVYYEPRRATGELSSRGGRQVYFATARVVSVRPDPTMANHFYAFVEDFLEFPHPVPFRDGDHYYESALRRADGGTSKGAFGRAVRPLSDNEYGLILTTASSELFVSARSSNVALPQGFADEPAEFERPIIERVTSRPFRDAAFSSAVRAAYDNTCAMTGLKIINGGGRPEVQAAHIRPVADSGPDSVRNGLALCGTIHWMFDRGLLSLDDDLTILMAGDRVPDTVKRLINPERKMLLPARPEFRPHHQFLQYHRAAIFKG
jgi:putative restriction endonuclease